MTDDAADPFSADRSADLSILAVALSYETLDMIDRDYRAVVRMPGEG